MAWTESKCCRKGYICNQNRYRKAMWYNRSMDEFDILVREAIQSVEDALNLERGWVNLSAGSEIIPAQSRIDTVKQARYYALNDPLAKRAVALMTDYSFGTGINWNAEDERADELLTLFWNDPNNKSVFSAAGQRKSSDRLLIDGELFFAVFPGRQSSIRRVDPLEITEFLTNPDDREDVRFYKREWVDAQAKQHTDYYRSFANLKNESCKDYLGASRQKTQDALIYHLAINDLGQRGNSYLLPALEWIKLYRRFLASRVAVMLALAKFAWKLKVQGGQTAVDAAVAKYSGQDVAAGSTHVENLGAELTQIRTDSGASQAYQDGRMLKLQVSAATGWPEQYMGDISIGNLATAKTVEAPVQRMIESYQSIWQGAYEDIFGFVMTSNGITDQYVDIDFPEVSQEAASSIAQAITLMVQTFPQLSESPDVLQQALLTMGIKNTSEVIDQLDKESKGDVNLMLARALREFRKEIKGDLSQL